jgi:membrane protease YdiL (CAAX protease family)
MAEWTAFAGFVGVVLAGLLLLARASAGAFAPPETPAATEYPATLGGRVVGRTETTPFSTATLLLNVVVSQGLFASLLLVGLWVASVPSASLGLATDPLAPTAVASGVVLGVSLYAVNTVGSRLSDRFGFGDATALRAAMAPDSAAGWAVLLLVVLPLVAGFEELLFRGVLIGAFATGFGLSPWLLAALSSVAFALGHGAQGRAGIAVTGALGFVLAAAFVLTGSLTTVIVAHYLVNALEFVVNER